MALVEGGLQLKLEGINEVLHGLENYDAAIDNASQATDRLGSIFLSFKGDIAPIPAILTQISQEAQGQLGLGALGQSVSILNATMLQFTNSLTALDLRLEQLSATPFEIHIKFPEALAENAVANIRVFESIVPVLQHVSSAIDGSGIDAKLQSIATILTAGASQQGVTAFSKGLAGLAKGIQELTNIGDISGFSKNIEALINSFKNFDTSLTGDLGLRIQDLAQSIPKLVGAFRSLTQTKNLDEFVLRMQSLAPVFQQLGTINTTGFLTDIPNIATGLGVLFNTFKQFGSGKAATNLAPALAAVSTSLKDVTTIFAGLSTDALTKLDAGLETVSKSFRNFGLAVKNFTASKTTLTDMTDAIKNFAQSLDSSLNIGNFISSITGIADSLAKFARSITSLSNSKNITDLKARFQDIAEGILTLANLNLPKIGKDLEALAGPLASLATVAGSVARVKDLSSLAKNLTDFNSQARASTGQASIFQKALQALGTAVSPIGSAFASLGAALLRLPLQFVVFNLQLLQKVFIALPLSIITGLFNGLIKVIEFFFSIIRAGLSILGAFATSLLKIITLGGALTGIFAIFGGGKKTAEDVNAVNNSLGESATRFKTTATSAQTYNVAMQKVTTTSSKAGSVLSGVGKAFVGAASGITAAGVVTAALNAGKFIVFGNSVLGLTKRLLSLAVAFKTVQVASGAISRVFQFAQIALRNTLGSALQATIAYEKLETAVTSLTARELQNSGAATSFIDALPQATQRAKETIAALEELAIISPFSIEDVQGAFTLAQTYGFITEEAKNLTAQVIDFVSATGQGGAEAEGIVRALGQISSRGKLQLEEANQLAERGINVVQLIAKSTGESAAAVLQSISKGGVGAEQALKVVRDSLGQFEGAAQRASHTVGGLIASISDLKDATLRTVFSGLFEGLKPFAEEAVTALQSAGIKEQLVTLSDTIRDNVTGAIQALAQPIGTMIGAFQAIPEPVKQGIATFLKFAGALAATTITFSVFQAVLLIIGSAVALFINPIALAVGAIIGLGTVIKNNIEVIQGFGQVISGYVGPALTSLFPTIAQFGQLFLNTALNVADSILNIQSVIGTLNFSGILGQINTIFTALQPTFSTIIQLFSQGFSRILEIVGSAGQQLNSFFTSQLGDLTSWGSALIQSFAQGVLDALSIVADAMQQLGEVIAYWLSPGSPPRAVPNIDKWGTAAAQEFLGGFSDADFGTITDFSGTLETLLNSLSIDPSSIDIEQVTTDFANLLDGVNKTGNANAEFINSLSDRTGLASGEVVQLANAYLQVQQQTEAAEKATSAYDAAVSKLEGGLASINASQEFAIEAKQLDALQKRLNNRFLSEEQKQATLKEIEKIRATQGIRSLKLQKEKQDEALDAAKENLDTEKARIALAAKFKDTGDAGLAAGGGAGGSLSDKLAKAAKEKKLKVGAPVLDFSKLDGAVATLSDNLGVNLNKPFEQFKETLASARKNFDKYVQDFKDKWAAIKKTLEDAGVTFDRVKALAIGMGAALAGIVFGPTVITVLGFLVTLASPLIVLAGAITAVAVGALLLKNNFDLTKTIAGISKFVDSVLGLVGVSASLISGFTGKKNLIAAITGFDITSANATAKSIGAVLGGIVGMFIGFQKRVLQVFGKIALGTNPIDAILSVFLNADYTGTGAAIISRIFQLFREIVNTIVGIPGKFIGNLADTNGGIAGIFQALIKTAEDLINHNPIEKLIFELLNFDLSKIKINIGGFEITGGKELGSKLADTLNGLFNTDLFSFLKNIDFSSPIDLIFSSLQAAGTGLSGIFDSLKTAFIDLIPPEVFTILELFQKAVGVIGLSIAAFQKNLNTEETGAALANLAKSFGFAAVEIGKLLAVIVAGVLTVGTLFAVGILPEIPKIITNIANALSKVFNFIGTSIQDVIDFVVSGNFTLENFAKLVIGIFNNFRSTILGVFGDFQNINNVIGDAIRNVINFFGQKFGFDATAVIAQFDTIINIVNQVGNILALVFGGIAIKVVFRLAKNLSVIKLLFLPIIKSAQLLIFPFKALITIISRLILGYKSLGTGIILLKREGGGLVKTTGGLVNLFKNLFAIIFKGRGAYGNLAKTTATVATKTAQVAASAGKATGLLGKFFGVFRLGGGFILKLIKPLGLLFAAFEGIKFLISSGLGDQLLGVFKAFTGFDIGAVLGGFSFSGLSDSLSFALEFALSYGFSGLPKIINGLLNKIDVGGIATVLKTQFAKLNFSTIFTALTTFPGFFTGIFGKVIGTVKNFVGVFGSSFKTIFSAVSRLVGFFKFGFGLIVSFIQPVITAISGLGSLFGPLLPLITNPITLIIGAVAFLGLAWYNNWFGIQEITANAIAWIQENVPPLASKLWQWIVDGSTIAFQKLGEWSAYILSAITELVVSLASSTAALGISLWNWLVNAVAEIPQRIQNFVSALTTEIITGAVAVGLAAVSYGIAFFAWLGPAIASIPAKFGEFLTGITTWITGTLGPNLIEQGPGIATSIFTGILGGLAIGILGILKGLYAIGTAIFAGIKTGIDTALQDPATAAILLPLIATFQEFAATVTTTFTSVKDTIVTLASSIGATVFTNPFEQMVSFINGEQGLLTTIANISLGFTNLVTDLTGITIPNPLDDLAAFFGGEINIFTLIKNVSTEFTTLVSDLTGISIPNPLGVIADFFNADVPLETKITAIGVVFNQVATIIKNLGIPNPFDLIAAGFGTLQTGLTEVQTNFTTVKTFLDSYNIPNPFGIINLGIDVLKRGLELLQTPFTTLQTFLSSLTFNDIFAILVSSMQNISDLISTVQTAFGDLQAFFSTLEFPNPFEGLTIPDSVKSALKIVGIDLGEEVAANVAEGTRDSTELSNADLPVTLSQNTFDNAKTQGQDIGKNIADGITEGASEATEDPGIFETAGNNIKNTWNSLWGINSPSTVARDELGVPIGEGILLGIQDAFTGANSQIQGIVDAIAGSFNLFLTGLVAKFTQSFLQISGAVSRFLMGFRTQTLSFLTSENEKWSTYNSDFIDTQTEFFDTVSTIIDDFYAAQIDLLESFTEFVIETITKMVDEFLSEIDRLSRETLSRLRSFLSSVKSIMQQFVEIMIQAAKDGVQGFVDYIKDNFADQATAAFKGALGAFYEKAKDEFYNTGKALGKPMMDGIIQGLEDNEDKLIKYAKDLAELLKKTFQQALGINSPSRVTRKIGSYTSQGLLLGLKDNEGKLVGGVKSLVNSMMSGSYAKQLREYAQNEFGSPFDNLFNNGQALAQNVNLQYNGLMTALPELSQGITVANAKRNINQMRAAQELATSQQSYASNRYVNSNSETHYHMHMTVGEKQAPNVRRHFSVLEHLTK